MKNLSQRTIDIEESPLTEWDSRVKKTVNRKGVVLLNAGQPDSDIPPVVREEIGEVVSEGGNNSYVSVGGTEEVRKVISLFQKRIFGSDYCSEETILTNGAKEGIFFSLGVLTNPGDEIIIIAPYWPTYWEIINFFEGKPVVVNTNEDFHLDIKKIEDAVTAKTKAIIINSPNNPSGAVYTKEELKQLAEIVSRYDLYVISDEIYGTIRYGNANHYSIASLEGMKERTIVVNGFSKSLSTTGYRLGYTLSSAEITEAMLKIKSNSTGNTNSLFQKVIVNILSDSFGCFDKLTASTERMREEFERRKNFLSQELDKLGIEYTNPEGAFYIFAKIPEKFEMKSKEFAEYLLGEVGVAVTPGIFFGNDFDGYIRISFASSMRDIEEAIKRIKEII